MSTNYGQVRPLSVEEKQAFDPIIYDFEQATGANLDMNSVALCLMGILRTLWVIICLVKTLTPLTRKT